MDIMRYRMAGKKAETVGELALELGERGDLVACLTSDIARQMDAGRPIDECDRQQLEDALEEIGALLDLAVDVDQAVQETAAGD